jgi:hypothetical protein
MKGKFKRIHSLSAFLPEVQYTRDGGMMAIDNRYGGVHDNKKSRCNRIHHALPSATQLGLHFNVISSLDKVIWQKFSHHSKSLYLLALTLPI